MTMKTISGFTLIETIVYLALFSILMGGIVLTAYNLFEGAGRNQVQAMVNNEGTFLIGKIQWALSGTQSVDQPVSGTVGSQLLVNKVIGVDSLGAPVIMPVSITCSTECSMAVPGNLLMATSGPSVVLNNSNIRITHLGFMVSGSGSFNDPIRVEASTTVTAVTPNGMLISRDFFATGYLRK